MGLNLSFAAYSVVGSGNFLKLFMPWSLYNLRMIIVSMSEFICED